MVSALKAREPTNNHPSSRSSLNLMQRLLSRGVLVASRSTYLLSRQMHQSVDGSVSGCVQVLASHNIADQPRQGVHAPRAPPTNLPSWQPQYPSGAATVPAFVSSFAYSPQAWTPGAPGAGYAPPILGGPLFESPAAGTLVGAPYTGVSHGPYSYSVPMASRDPRLASLQSQSPFVPLVPHSRTPQASGDPVQGYAHYSAQHYEDSDPQLDVSASSLQDALVADCLVS
jgi:hypothetical protein